jgi:hypothetical protein
MHRRRNLRLSSDNLPDANFVNSSHKCFTVMAATNAEGVRSAIVCKFVTRNGCRRSIGSLGNELPVEEHPHGCSCFYEGNVRPLI